MPAPNVEHRRQLCIWMATIAVCSLARDSFGHAVLYELSGSIISTGRGDPWNVGHELLPIHVSLLVDDASGVGDFVEVPKADGVNEHVQLRNVENIELMVQLGEDVNLPVEVTELFFLDGYWHPFCCEVDVAFFELNVFRDDDWGSVGLGFVMHSSSFELHADAFPPTFSQRAVHENLGMIWNEEEYGLADGWALSGMSIPTGDATLDGEFNSGDLVRVFGAGEYEDDISLNSTWATGDWDGDGDFASGDLVVAFQDGGYELGPRELVHSVPEPSSGALIVLAAIAFWTWLANQLRWI